MKTLKIVVLLLISSSAFAQTTLRIATYNLLNFSDTSTNRIQALATVIRAIDPDVLVVQELSNHDGYDTFYNQVMLQVHNDYQRAPYMNDAFTDNGLFYRENRVVLVNTDTVSIGLRPMSRYDLQAFGQNFTVYGVHLKASSGTQNENIRSDQADIIRRHLNDRNATDNFILAGDFNLYDDDEPAFQLLTGIQQDNDGRLFDPVNRIGDWHNSGQFADVHTQSPRTTQFGGGAHGGLDDRFDFMLVSNALISPGDIDYQAGSYTALGNDGTHFNQAINDGLNNSVPPNVADALHFASDHLPVYGDFLFLNAISEPPMERAEVVGSLEAAEAVIDSLSAEQWALDQIVVIFRRAQN